MAKEGQSNRTVPKSHDVLVVCIIIVACLLVNGIACIVAITKSANDSVSTQQQAPNQNERTLPAIEVIEPEKTYTKAEQCALIEQATTTFLQHIPADIEFAMSYHALTTDCTYTYNEAMNFQAASTVKVAIALYVYDEIALGNLSEDTWLSYDEARHFEAGAGPLQYETDFTGADVATLVALMIQESDNIATNMLLSQLGWTIGTQRYIERITGITPVDPTKNELSVSQQQAILTYLWQATTPGRDEILTLMQTTSDQSRIATITTTATTPITVAHKIGDYPDDDANYYHDIAIVDGQRPYIVVIMSKSTGVSNETIYTYIAKYAQLLQNINEIPLL